MIKTKSQLIEYIQAEENECKKIGYKGIIHSFVTQCEIGKIHSFLVTLRKDEYFSNNAERGFFYKALSLMYRRKHNKLGLKLGISIPINTFGKGLIIYHSQGIIVHRNALIGENCKLHGLTCIGNNGGNNDDATPILGNNIDIGVGASIIGNVKLADNIKIAAGAVVCNSCEKDGVVLKGIPAKYKTE